MISLRAPCPACAAMTRHRVDAESFEYGHCCDNPEHHTFVEDFVEHATFTVVCTQCGTAGLLRRRYWDVENAYCWSRDGSANTWMSGGPSGEEWWWVSGEDF